MIKHGSPGTGMIGFGSMLSDEELRAIIQYERGARTCSACHAFPAGVRSLMKKGEGGHRPGAFARCLCCHIGGKLDIDD